MGPEQSEGRIENLGAASDVYSLGATLYKILTGKEPFESTIVGVVLGKVRSGDFLPPRERNPSVPRALNAICLNGASHRADRSEFFFRPCSRSTAEGKTRVIRRTA
jgi:serine/threonine protein kinase